jgi:hypothetical protein
MHDRGFFRSGTRAPLDGTLPPWGEPPATVPAGRAEDPENGAGAGDPAGEGRLAGEPMADPVGGSA